MQRKQSLQEEFANSITHGFGILFSIVAISLLVTFSMLNGSTIEIVSSSIFGASILFLYTFSTLYHSVQQEKVKSWLRTFDHIGIYLLIAGTYTPFLLLTVGGKTGWIFFGIIWGLAAFGLVFKIFFTHRFKKASLILYLGMGWMAILLIKPLFQNLDINTLSLIAAGGLSYTLGTLFYTRPQMRFAHTIWHLFVLAGTILHFIAIMFILQTPA
ncbi:Putative membrane protein hemolysin III [Indibacter alkaliphilus LW1]|jgi:hemolysin III|uniref:Membrane protein hemolysin III n=1 Tax=Indibacter alkaliphilus (strain CCUG 57479 / KCTC 22604 / LW1) TaxID=1189612 RepID=S2E3K6_INDAL|nr:hemolysin III family protein [Indibacter alkaliphilus]EOZ99071.1 Putative membrane protein hemolysin III [Indibacter alkaliphilus LW1]